MKKIELEIVEFLKKTGEIDSQNVVSYLSDEYVMHPMAAALVFERLLERREIKARVLGDDILLSIGAMTSDETAVFERETTRLKLKIDAEIKVAQEEAKMAAESTGPSNKKFYN